MTIKEIAVIRQACLGTLMFFIRYFFKLRFKRKFVQGEHHKIIADALEKVYAGQIKRLIINIAPRYGKTEEAVKNFIAAGLAHNPAAKFIHLSYSKDLALDNSTEIRELVQSAEYQQLFPETRVTDRGAQKWYTTKGGGVYATATGGQVTGFGAGQVDEEIDEDTMDEFTGQQPGIFGGAIVIDDPIKPEDADSDIIREKINQRFYSTISNRVNSRNTPIVIIMQRLHEMDLCGSLIENEPGIWTVISLPSIKDDGTALWPFKHTIEELRAEEKKNPIVFQRQHMQNPMPMQGRLYKSFKTYQRLPEDCSKRKAVIDTADTGEDYLCSIVYAPILTGYYILDVLYTDEPMEVTEPETARQMTLHGVHEAKIESNNGGRGFTRNIERICRENDNRRTSFSWYHQSENKQTRIFTNAAEVQNMIYYPEDWERRWPAFAKHVKSYMAAGKNKNDDAEDALTMIIEAEAKKKIGVYSY